MNSKMDSQTQILEIAERRMRISGYNAVSYRDIAGDLGIKSSSLHYHFPKKEDLGMALVQRYSQLFQQRLETQTKSLTHPKDKLAEFIDIYRHALIKQKLVCLCAILGAEAPGLPPMITKEVNTFFEANIAWLKDIYTDLKCKNAATLATSTLSLLEGAMIVSSVNKNNDIFEAAAELIEQQFIISSK